MRPLFTFSEIENILNGLHYFILSSFICITVILRKVRLGSKAKLNGRVYWSKIEKLTNREFGNKIENITKMILAAFFERSFGVVRILAQRQYQIHQIENRAAYQVVGCNSCFKNTKV